MSVRVVVIFLLLAVAVLLVGCESDPAGYIREDIGRITDNPGSYDGRPVLLEGYVPMLLESVDGTFYYLLQGDFGQPLRVNASSYPEVGKKYAVWGTLSVPQGRNVLQLHQVDRSLVMKWYEQSWFYIALVAAVIALVVLLVVQYSTRASVGAGPDRPPVVGPGTSGPRPGDPVIPPMGERRKTVILPPPPPEDSFASRTMIFIPGKLTFTSGPDEGTSLTLPGYPMDMGSVLTVGRHTETGPRKWAHIEVRSEQVTVSEKQAEIWFIANRVSIKSLSSSNYTMLNGEKMMPGEMRDLNPGDDIKMGELEFRYSL